MKKILLYALISVSFMQLQSMAVITTEEQFSEDYIINHGYSTEMARLMRLQHDQINGIHPTMSENTHVYRPWENLGRRFLMYLDPGLDDERFMQHDTKYTVRWDSL